MPGVRRVVVVAVEIQDDTRRFSTMPVDGGDQVVFAAVMQKEEPLPDAPERGRAELRAGGRTLRDIIAGPDVMEQEIREEGGGLEPQRRVQVIARCHLLPVTDSASRLVERRFSRLNLLT